LVGITLWITSAGEKCTDKESGKNLAAQTKPTYHMINALKACHLNTLAANKQSQDQQKP